MNQDTQDFDFNRRDFLKGGSLATLMTMLGGVRLFGQSSENHDSSSQYTGPKLQVGIIGLGPWGRQILETLSLVEEAKVAAICDNYKAFLHRGSRMAPKEAIKTLNYKDLLNNKDVQAVVIAIPTYLHKDMAIEALKAGKHVYCEAPLATTLEDTRALCLAAKNTPQVLFQAGYQNRCDPNRLFLVPFIREGSLGINAVARAQWHKKTSWHITAPTDEREKAANWRLHNATSIGLAGELGCHQFDDVSWFLNSKPTAITGWGTIARWKSDGRDVPDTVQAVFEYPAGVNLVYDATLANSFDASYEMVYGSDAAIMLRDDQIWMFEEIDSPLHGWEVFASKKKFIDETGIAIRANASKAVQKPRSQMTQTEILQQSPLYSAFRNFSLNTLQVATTVEGLKELGELDTDSVRSEVDKLKLWPAPGYTEGFRATVTAIKANEAILQRKRIELKPDVYELT
jgi:predicted dehydrogenase